MSKSQVISCESPSVHFAAVHAGALAFEPCAMPENQPSVQLDVATTRRQFERLCAKLNHLQSNLIVARRLSADVMPSLLEMACVLQPSKEHDKNELKEAGLPSWSTFLREFCRQIGYSPAEMRNLLRENRGLARISPSNKSADRHARQMLTRLLDVVETSGDRLPVLVSDVCRSIHRVLSGRLGIRDWREAQNALDRVRAINGWHEASSRVKSTCRPSLANLNIHETNGH
jgi:hypothetical protein